jgi:hypothetical protein
MQHALIGFGVTDYERWLGFEILAIEGRLVLED